MANLGHIKNKSALLRKEARKTFVILMESHV